MHETIMVSILLSHLWEFCKSYGFHLIVSVALSILTVYRREISCNNIYHDNKNSVTAGVLTQVSSSDGDNPRRRQQMSPNREPHRGCDRDKSLVLSTEVDQWLLLEHCCYGVAFGPLFSLATFLCRTVILILFQTLSLALCGYYRQKKKSASTVEMSMRGDIRSNSCESEQLAGEHNIPASQDTHSDTYTAGDADHACNNTLTPFRHALAHEWNICKRQGFHYPSVMTDSRSRFQKGNNRLSSFHDTIEADPIMHVLPQDVQLLVMSYLPVNDILTYGLTSKLSRKLVFSTRVAYPLWNLITLRDFKDLLQWDVAQQRFQECIIRATCQTTNTGKEELSSTENALLSFVEDWHTQWAYVQQQSLHPGIFTLPGSGNIEDDSTKSKPHRQRLPQVYDLYFALHVTWLPWSIALRNTTEHCLVGLYNAVYDITSFLPHHPGSVETLLIHAGTDATGTFEAVRHSTRARSLADRMCVLKMGDIGDVCEGYPERASLSNLSARSGQWRSAGSASGNTAAASSLFSLGAETGTSEETMAASIVRRITERLVQEEKRCRAIAEKILFSQLEIVVGDALHLLYDPFIRSWCCWYTSLTTEGELEPIMMYVDLM